MNHVSWAAGDSTAGGGAAPPHQQQHQFSNNIKNIVDSGPNNNAAAEGQANPAASAVMESIFHLGPRFSNFKVVGKGSFGEVCSALDSQQVLLYARSYRYRLGTACLL